MQLQDQAQFVLSPVAGTNFEAGASSDSLPSVLIPKSAADEFDELFDSFADRPDSKGFFACRMFVSGCEKKEPPMNMMVN